MSILSAIVDSKRSRSNALISWKRIQSIHVIWICKDTLLFKEFQTMLKSLQSSYGPACLHLYTTQKDPEGEVAGISVLSGRPALETILPGFVKDSSTGEALICGVGMKGLHE